MRGKRLSIGMRAALTIFTVTLLVATLGAATQEKVLYSFHRTDGFFPEAGLIFDGAGNLYGTTSQGGTYGYGMVFELTPAAGGGWTLKVLYNFNGADGNSPIAGLIFDSSGNLYGTTFWGGTYHNGIVFELQRSPNAVGGSWTLKVLYNFNGNGFAGPRAGLIFDAAGNLYGTTAGGGTYGYGTVFELMPVPGGRWKEKVLHSFSYTDGAFPYAGVIFDAAGNLYGTTGNGGAGYNCSFACGVVFELTSAAGGGWTETILHNFNGADGAGPNALIFDAAGNLYGTAGGGTYGSGTVFELTPESGGGWTETGLYDFNGTDGSGPVAGLIFDAAGNLYGMTSRGGTDSSCSTDGCGTVFEIIR